MKPLAFVACSKRKLAHKAEAQDLYQGSLFRAARAWAEAHCDHWFILSARHGLIEPTCLVAPYNDSLLDKTERQRLDWSKDVFNEVNALRQLRAFPEPGQTPGIVLLAGHNYRSYLFDDLRQAGYNVAVPLAGLSYVMQVARLKKMLSEDSSMLFNSASLTTTPGQSVIAAQVAGSNGSPGHKLQSEAEQALDLILGQVAAELPAQRELWGAQLNQPLCWNAVLGRAVGAVNDALVDFDSAALRQELVHVAAVAILFARSLDESQARRR